MWPKNRIVQYASTGSFIFVVISSIILHNHFFANNARQDTVKREILSAAPAGNVSEEKLKWSRRIDEVGAEKAYREFKAAYADAEFNTQHRDAHLIGILLYEKEGINGLAVCDNSFAFGCYHGFFGVALAEKGVGVIPDLDRACTEKYGDRGTGCQHGIGHGIMEYLGRDRLLQALDLCGKTIQRNELFGCTSGLFMEYNMAITFPSGNAVTDTRRLNPADPREPCDTIVPKKFRDSCYFEISLWWKQVFNGNYEIIGGLCRGLNDQNQRQSCFMGLGTVATPSADYEVGGTLAICRKMGSVEGDAFCRIGAAGSLFNTDNFKDRGFPVCQGINDDKLKQTCLQQLPVTRTHLKNLFGRDIGQSFGAHEARTKVYPLWYSESEATPRHERLAISRKGCGDFLLPLRCACVGVAWATPSSARLADRIKSLATRLEGVFEMGSRNYKVDG